MKIPAALGSMLLWLAPVSVFAQDDYGPRMSLAGTIKSSNFCGVAADCIDIGGACPFGCHNVVNRAEAERIKTSLTAFSSNSLVPCKNRCSALPIKIECKVGKCSWTYQPEKNDSAER